MSIFLQNGDTITGEGIRWANVGLKQWDGAVSDSGRHIEWTAPADGDFSLTFQISAVDTGKKVYPFMCVATNEQLMVYSSSAWKSLQAKNIDTDYTISFSATKGTLYKLYAYYQNRDSDVRVSSATFSYAPTFFTATAAVNNANYGSAVVDGAAAAEVFSGREVTFVATPVSSAYRFVNWTDGEENIVSTEATLTIPVSADVAYTANFEKAAAGDSVEMRYDFGSFTGGNAVTESGNQKITTYGPFEIYTSDSKRGNDSITENGIYWHVPANDIYYKNYNADQPCDYVHYIKFTAPVDGSVSIIFKTDTVVSNRKLSLCVTTGELSAATWNNKIISVQPSSANTDYTLTQEVTAGTTYWFWCASQNWDAGNAPTATTIASITYTHASDLTTLTVSNSDATAGTVTVNGASITEAIDVQKGEYVHLVATPTGANAFNGWKNGNDEVVYTDADIWLCVEEATTLTATWRSVNPHSFVWNWKVSEGNWNNPANWLYEGVIKASTYPSNSSQDVVTFNTAATVNLPAAAAASNVTFNAAVTMQSDDANRYGLSAKLVDGTGAVTLANAGFATPLNTVATNNVNIIMAAGTTNWFNTVANKDWGPEMVLNGNISGQGCYQLNLASYQGCGVKVNGNNNDFYGDVYTTGGNSHRSRIWWGENAMSTNAYVHLGHSYRDKNDSNNAGLMGNAISVGGYDGVWYDKWDGSVLTIGYLNRDSSLSIYNYFSGRANSVTKVGPANLTLGTTRIKNLTVGEGSVTMPVGIAPQTLTVAEGAKVIIPGDVSWTAGTVTNLFSYTTLSGATSATLPCQVEVTGLAEGLVAKITVEDNTVTATIEAAEVAPTTDDENATITKNGDGTYTVQVEAEAVAITVPDGVTVSEVVVSPDTATVTGVPANATVKVAVSWADAQETQHSAAYAIVNVNSETGAVSLDEDAVVTVGDEEISLRPELSDAGDEVAPLDVGEDVSVGVKSIPGLVYRLARGTAVDEIDTSAANAIAEEKAISSRVSLVDDNPPSDGAFYKVTVELE